MSSPAVAEQYRLFDLGLNLARLRTAKEQLMISAKAPNTMKAYRQSWKVFTEWCADAGRAACPASPDTVGLFVTWAAKERRYRLETIRLALSSIKYHHEAAGFASPINHEVKELVSSAAREAREARNGKAHLTVAQLRQICRALGDDDPLDVRDRALILIGYASGWRRSELSALAWDHVKFERDGVRLWLPFSKTDQEGRGRETCIPYGKTPYTCPVRALKAWLKRRGDWHGPVFVQFTAAGPDGYRLMRREALSGAAICAALKRALERIGEDPDAYGAHSLRSGMITAAAEKGVPLRAIMDRSGHKSLDTVLRYVRSSPDAFRADPLAGVL
jgi:integrase